MPWYKKIIIGILIWTSCCGLTGIKTKPYINLDMVIDGSSYQIFINTCGCFGCSEDIYKIVKDEGGKTALLTYSVLVGDKYLDRTNRIAWGAAKEQLLKQLFLKGMKGYGDGWCTNETEYKLYRAPYTIAFTDGRCAYDDMIKQLLE